DAPTERVQDGDPPAAVPVPERDVALNTARRQFRSVPRKGDAPGSPASDVDAQPIQLRAGVHVPEPDDRSAPRDGEDPAVRGEGQGPRGIDRTAADAG